MNSVNKTLYIPLYGKAYVSRRGIVLNDKKAEEIWAAEGFALRGKAKSKWLAYYMGMRAAVFDMWTAAQLQQAEDDTVVIHIGCGMDSRALRVNAPCRWYDVDFADVIAERQRYFAETDRYRMLCGDARQSDWLQHIPEHGRAIVVMEGVSMYLGTEAMRQLLANLCVHFSHVSLLADFYTELAAKLSRFKNPINTVGVTRVFGMDDPLQLQSDALHFAAEHEMTPQVFISQLPKSEQRLFRKLYAGSFAARLYRLYSYKTT